MFHRGYGTGKILIILTTHAIPYLKQDNKLYEERVEWCWFFLCFFWSPCIVLGFGGGETLSIVKQRYLKLEQLQRLRSEDTPVASWLPTLLSHIGPQVKKGHYMRHTLWC